nr:hypothetical protein [Anaerolineae bacterium]
MPEEKRFSVLPVVALVFAIVVMVLLWLRITGQLPAIRLVVESPQPDITELASSPTSSEAPVWASTYATDPVEPPVIFTALPSATRSVSPINTVPFDTLVPTPARTPTGTPTALVTVTPTSIPSQDLGDAIRMVIDPVIDDASFYHPDATAAYVDNHPWVGALSWTEQGALIGGRLTVIEQAEKVSFYALQPGDPLGTTDSFLIVTYNGAFTRLDYRGLVFYEQRTEEILYWLVRRAAERGGQLIVAYDGIGAQQAVIVVDYKSFAPSAP